MMRNLLRGLFSPWNGTVLGAWAAALVLSLALSFLTYGTNDVLFYEAHVRTIQTQGAAALYEYGSEVRGGGVDGHREPFWLPPFIINYLRLLNRLASVTGLTVGTWMKLISSLAAAALSLFLLRLHPTTTPVAVLIVLAPVTIIVAGFHGNTDPVMLALLVAAVYTAERGGGAGGSGALYGMSCAFKVWPAVFLPCFLLFFPSWRQRLRFALIAGLWWTAAGMPYLARGPVFILEKILSYRSENMFWGVRLITTFASPALDSAVAQYGSLVLFALIAIVSVALARRRIRLHIQVGLIAALFLFLSPGFGYQYLIWLTPALVFLSAGQLVAWNLISGSYLVLIYLSYMEPGWLANTLTRGPTLGEAASAVPVWLLVGGLLLPSAWRAARADRKSLAAGAAVARDIMV